MGGRRTEGCGQEARAESQHADQQDEASWNFALAAGRSDASRLLSHIAIVTRKQHDGVMSSRTRGTATRDLRVPARTISRLLERRMHWSGHRSRDALHIREGDVR